MNTEIVMRPLAPLKVHPALLALPGLAETDEEFAAGLRDVRERGIIQPLLVTEDGRIVDGRHRKRWAELAGLVKVPCTICEAKSDAEVVGLALRTLVHRRHYTPGQVALVAYPLLRASHEAARAAADEAFESQKKKGLAAPGPAAAVPAKSSTYGSTSATIREICAGYGFSEDSFSRAARIHEIFGLSDDLQLQWQQDIIEDAGLEEGRAYTAREVFWPRLMRRESPLGLGQAVAGLCGRPEIDELLNDAKRGKSKKGGRPQDDEVGVT